MRRRTEISWGKNRYQTRLLAFRLFLLIPQRRTTESDVCCAEFSREAIMVSSAITRWLQCGT